MKKRKHYFQVHKNKNPKKVVSYTDWGKIEKAIIKAAEVVDLMLLICKLRRSIAPVSKEHPKVTMNGDNNDIDSILLNGKLTSIANQIAISSPEEMEKISRQFSEVSKRINMFNEDIKNNSVSSEHFKLSQNRAFKIQ